MLQRALSLILLVLMVFAVSSCGKDPIPEPDPYETLSYNRWVHRYNITENDQRVDITITIKFGDNRIYSFKQTGLVSGSGEEVPAYTIDEAGMYEVTTTETNKGSITFTPNDDTPAYTVQWAILPPEGNLFLTYSDGETIEFDVQRTANN